VSNTPDFESLAGGPDLGEEERSRLLTAHEALLAAGPPAELSPRLARAPRVDAHVVRIPSGRRRAMMVLAAALALVAFTVGASLNRPGSTAFAAAWTHPMKGTAAAPNAVATISGTKKDSAGNWQMRLQAAGLPKLRGREYYILWLTKHGRPIAECGSFVVGDGATVETFAEPYEVHEFDGWVVTRWRGPKSPTGPALLKTQTV
jgi:hypothetical protein